MAHGPAAAVAATGRCGVAAAAVVAVGAGLGRRQRQHEQRRQKGTDSLRGYTVALHGIPLVGANG